jgi:hypothetical protein
MWCTFYIFWSFLATFREVFNNNNNKNILMASYLQLSVTSKCKGKAITLQVLTGPVGYRRLRLPDFKTIGT